MAHLILASTKIPAELSDRLKRFTESNGVNQSAAIRRAIEQFLDNAESTGLSQLTNTEGNFKPAELVERVDAVDSRLTDVEARLRALETREKPTPPIAAAVVKAPIAVPTVSLGHDCPSCGSSDIDKRGFGKVRIDGSKAQRLKCRSCGRAFSIG